MRSGWRRWRWSGLSSVLLTDGLSLLLLPDPLHDVSEELDDLLLTLGRGLEDVEECLGCGLILGHHPLEPDVERLGDHGVGTPALSLLSLLLVSLSLLGSQPPPVLRF